MSVLSSLAALIALIISIRSLQVNEITMEVAHRAYVTLSGGQIDHAFFNAMPVGLTCNINNLGPTPARFVAGHVRLTVPSDWNTSQATLLERDDKRGVAVYLATIEAEHLPPPMSGKSEAHLNFGLVFDLSEPAKHKLRRHMRFLRSGSAEEAGPYFEDTPIAIIPERIVTSTILNAQGVLRYVDIFEKTHEVKWCWETNFGSRYPDDCSHLAKE